MSRKIILPQNTEKLIQHISESRLKKGHNFPEKQMSNINVMEFL